MTARTRSLLGLCIVLPLAAGCASRTAPFNDLDKAQVTVLKLQGQEVAPNPMQPGPGLPMIPIPGLTPEQQQQLQQGAQQLQQGLQGLIPGLPPFPGMPGQPAPGQPASAARFNGFVILGSAPLADEDMKDEILDIFGDEDSFSQNRGQCFTPGMGIVFASPDKGNIELMVSLSCNQAMGNGFQWPYNKNGFTPETSQKLRRIYETMWGPAPPSGV